MAARISEPSHTIIESESTASTQQPKKPFLFNTAIFVWFRGFIKKGRKKEEEFVCFCGKNNGDKRSCWWIGSNCEKTRKLCRWVIFLSFIYVPYFNGIVQILTWTKRKLRWFFLSPRPPFLPPLCFCFYYHSVHWQQRSYKHESLSSGSVRAPQGRSDIDNLASWLMRSVSQSV
jgi:hypothetical protein